MDFDVNAFLKSEEPSTNAQASQPASDNKGAFDVNSFIGSNGDKEENQQLDPTFRQNIAEQRLLKSNLPDSERIAAEQDYIKAHVDRQSKGLAYEVGTNIPSLKQIGQAAEKIGSGIANTTNEAINEYLQNPLKSAGSALAGAGSGLIKLGQGAANIGFTAGNYLGRAYSTPEETAKADLARLYANKSVDEFTNKLSNVFGAPASSEVGSTVAQLLSPEVGESGIIGNTVSKVSQKAANVASATADVGKEFGASLIDLLPKGAIPKVFEQSPARMFESRISDRIARLQDINNAIFDPQNSNLLKLRPDLTTDQLLDQANKLRSSIAANRNAANIVDKSGSFLDWAVRNGFKVGGGTAAGGIIGGFASPTAGNKEAVAGGELIGASYSMLNDALRNGFEGNKGTAASGGISPNAGNTQTVAGTANVGGVTPSAAGSAQPVAASGNAGKFSSPIAVNPQPVAGGQLIGTSYPMLRQQGVSLLDRINRAVDEAGAVVDGTGLLNNKKIDMDAVNTVAADILNGKTPPPVDNAQLSKPNVQFGLEHGHPPEQTPTAEEMIKATQNEVPNVPQRTPSPTEGGKVQPQFNRPRIETSYGVGAQVGPNRFQYANRQGLDPAILSSFERETPTVNPHPEDEIIAFGHDGNNVLTTKWQSGSKDSTPVTRRVYTNFTPELFEQFRNSPNKADFLNDLAYNKGGSGVGMLRVMSSDAQLSDLVNRVRNGDLQFDQNGDFKIGTGQPAENVQVPAKPLTAAPAPSAPVPTNPVTLKKPASSVAENPRYGTAADIKQQFEAEQARQQFKEEVGKTATNVEQQQAAEANLKKQAQAQEEAKQKAISDKAEQKKIEEARSSPEYKQMTEWLKAADKLAKRQVRSQSSLIGAERNPTAEQISNATQAGGAVALNKIPAGQLDQALAEIQSPKTEQPTYPAFSGKQTVQGVPAKEVPVISEKLTPKQESIKQAFLDHFAKIEQNRANNALAAKLKEDLANKAAQANKPLANAPAPKTARKKVSLAAKQPHEGPEEKPLGTSSP